MDSDLEIVKNIKNGDSCSWERFVNQYSPWVLYRARVWCGHDCFLSSCTACCLVTLSNSLKGEKPSPQEDACGEGIDIYIWIFEELRKRVTKYSGRKNSSLSTFVWSVLNSKNLYIDWLRDKYGRII